MEHEADARRIAGPDHRPQIGADGGGRLLAEDVDPTPRSQVNERRCDSGRVQISTNLDKIQPLLALEQGSGGGVEPGPGELCRCLLKPLPVQIAEAASLACETLAQPST